MPAQTPRCSQPNGLVWQLGGQWKGDASPLAFMSPVRAATRLTLVSPEEGKSGGRILILGNGVYFLRTCSAPGRCRDECPAIGPAPANNQLPKLSRPVFESMVSGLSTRPGFRDAMSKSSIWTDALAAVSGHTADLAPVLAGTRPRTIRMRLCPVDRATPCGNPFHIVDWTGKTALLTGNEVAPNLYRVVEGDEEIDAWVKLVPKESLPGVQAEYAEALKTVYNWQPPDGDADAPSLERLRRLILATVGTR